MFLVSWTLWPRAVKNLHARRGPVVVFGDSLSAGVGSEKGGGWVTLLAQKLGRELINRSRSGETTEGGAARLDAEVLTLHPALVVLELGANDFLQRMPLDGTFERLDGMVQKIQADGAAVLLLGVQNQLLGDGAEKHYRELARRRGTGYVPNIMADIFTRPERRSDDIHPNDAGYAVMAGRIEPELVRLLPLP